MRRVLERYRALTAKVDAFFARVASRYASDMPCAAGCSSCCQAGLTVTGVEAEAIRVWVSALPDELRHDLSSAARARTTSCAALDDAGRCRIYPARPLVCRSHGLPIRLHVTDSDSASVSASASAPASVPDPAADSTPVRPERRAGLPVITSCELTFRTHGPAAADADCVLDQQLVSTMLGLIDRGFAEARGELPGARVDLGELLGGLDRDPPP